MSIYKDMLDDGRKGKRVRWTCSIIPKKIGEMFWLGEIAVRECEPTRGRNEREKGRIGVRECGLAMGVSNIVEKDRN